MPSVAQRRLLFRRPGDFRPCIFRECNRNVEENPMNLFGIPRRMR